MVVMPAPGDDSQSQVDPEDLQPKCLHLSLSPSLPVSLGYYWGQGPTPPPHTS